MSVGVLQRGKSLRPDDGAVEGQSGQIAVPENGENKLAVGRGRWRGIARVLENLSGWRGSGRNFHGPAPEQPAIFGRVGKDFAAGSRATGDKNVIAPDDWRAVSGREYGSFPGNSRSGLYFP